MWQRGRGWAARYMATAASHTGGMWRTSGCSRVTVPSPSCAAQQVSSKKHPKMGTTGLWSSLCYLMHFFPFYWRKAQLGLSTIVCLCPFNEEAQAAAVLVPWVMEWCFTELLLLGNNSFLAGWWETVGRVTTATSAWGKQYAAQVLAQEDTEVPASRISTALKKGCMAGTSQCVWRAVQVMAPN